MCAALDFEELTLSHHGACHGNTCEARLPCASSFVRLGPQRQAYHAYFCSGSSRSTLTAFSGRGLLTEQFRGHLRALGPLLQKAMSSGPRRRAIALHSSELYSEKTALEPNIVH